MRGRQRCVFRQFHGGGVLCRTAWTGKDRGVRLRQCVDNGDVPCHCLASVTGYQWAAVGALAVDSDQMQPWFSDS